MSPKPRPDWHQNSSGLEKMIWINRIFGDRTPNVLLFSSGYKSNIPDLQAVLAGAKILFPFRTDFAKEVEIQLAADGNYFLRIRNADILWSELTVAGMNFFLVEAVDDDGKLRVNFVEQWVAASFIPGSLVRVRKELDDFGVLDAGSSAKPVFPSSDIVFEVVLTDFMPFEERARQLHEAMRCFPILAHVVLNRSHGHSLNIHYGTVQMVRLLPATEATTGTKEVVVSASALELIANE